MNDVAPFRLELSRFIRAPREDVYDAFVVRDTLAAWICPRGLTVPEAAVDARVGGRYRLVMRARDGDTFVVGGTYREMVRPERLVFTWQWQGDRMPNVETVVTCTFVSRAGGTDVTLLHTGFPAAALRDGHGHGWRSSLNKLTDRLDPRGSAATMTLIGDPRSTFVRTARMGLAEKGVACTLEPAGPHTPEVLAVHPFGRIPALRDGDITLFETTAILRYAEESFDGPSLLPPTIMGRALCEQWTSAIASYVYDAMVRRYVLHYIFPRGSDGRPDRAVIDLALGEITGHLATLDRAYDGREYLVGTAPCMADLLLAPILAYVERMPEGASLLAAVPNVRRAQEVMRARPSFRDTEPPQAA